MLQKEGECDDYRFFIQVFRKEALHKTLISYVSNTVLQCVGNDTIRGRV
jgi:hypothetical protein